MTTNEFRALPDNELRTRLDEVQEEFFNLRFQNGTGQLENYKRLGIVKRDIARINTLIKERELGIEIAVKAEPEFKRKPKEQDDKKSRRSEKQAETETVATSVVATGDDEMAEVATPEAVAADEIAEEPVTDAATEGDES